ncbi:LysR substrate-binding domain-containing protein, partial [Arthrospira platensis SPKY1]|nr:LysR substrate-binding domain-containing protein [Arthrospira platensis SPKY1]
EMLSLGKEVLAPFCKPDALGEPAYCLPGSQTQPVPFLAYAPGAYLGRVMDWVIRQSDQAVHLERVYETDMSESLKAMAIEGHGLAFLPTSSVGQALADGRLVHAAPRHPVWRGELDIRLYRERPQGRKGKPVAQAFWAQLQAHVGPA